MSVEQPATTTISLLLTGPTFSLAFITLFFNFGQQRLWQVCCVSFRCWLVSRRCRPFQSSSKDSSDPKCSAFSSPYNCVCPLNDGEIYHFIVVDAQLRRFCRGFTQRSSRFRYCLFFLHCDNNNNDNNQILTQTRSSLSLSKCGHSLSERE